MRVCQRLRRHLWESLRDWLSVPPFTHAFLKSPSSCGLSAIAELLVWISFEKLTNHTHNLEKSGNLKVVSENWGKCEQSGESKGKCFCLCILVRWTQLYHDFIWLRLVTLSPPIPLRLKPLPSAKQHPSYGDCLEVKREYYQNGSVLDCVTRCSQSTAHLYEQFLQVKQIGFATLGPLHCV